MKALNWDHHAGSGAAERNRQCVQEAETEVMQPQVTDPLHEQPGAALQTPPL